jgi:multidrug efflux pump
MAAMVAATPAFIMLTGFINLFGIGGASFISRSLGRGDVEGAQKAARLSIWGGVFSALVYGVSIFLFRHKILALLGAKNETYQYAGQYLFWTTAIGAIPTVLNPILALLIRSEGAAQEAGFGILLGCLLNIVFDPIFMFTFRLGIAGAAVATMISNWIAVGYFLIYLYKHRDTTVIRFRQSKAPIDPKVLWEIVTVGMPGFFIATTAVVSNIVLTHLLALYSTEAVAGAGIAKKINLVAYQVAQGIAEGVLPLIGYCYAARKFDRVRKIIRFTLVLGLVVEIVFMCFLYVFSKQITQYFIVDQKTIQYGHDFLRIICLVCPFTLVNFLIVYTFQAVGKKIQPLFLSMLRKGLLDIPLMFFFRRVLGVYGVMWTTPVTEWIALTISLVIVMPLLKELRRGVPLETM